MRKVRVEEDCCAERESLMKKKEAARSRKKSRNVTSSCCAGKRLTCAEISIEQAYVINVKPYRNVEVEEEPPIKCGKIVKKRPKRIVKKQESCTIDFRILARIKPSISERERYFNIHHLMCVLEVEELIRFREIQKIREKMEESDDLDSEILTDKQTPESYQSIKQITSSTKSFKSVTSNDENVEEKSLTVGGKTSEQTAENKNLHKKVEIAEGKCALENKIECSSICSFDSEIDLSGLHLTKEDIEKIEKNREQIREQQKSKKSDADEE